MKQFLTISLLFCGIMVASSKKRVRYRERDIIVPGNNPIGCNTVVHVVEHQDISGIWITDSYNVTYDSCNGGTGWQN